MILSIPGHCLFPYFLLQELIEKNNEEGVQSKTQEFLLRVNGIYNSAFNMDGMGRPDIRISTDAERSNDSNNSTKSNDMGDINMCNIYTDNINSIVVGCGQNGESIYSNDITTITNGEEVL